MPRAVAALQRCPLSTAKVSETAPNAVHLFSHRARMVAERAAGTEDAMLYLIPILSLALLAPTAPDGGPAGDEVPVRQGPIAAGLEVVIDPTTGEIVNNPSGLEIERTAEGITIGARRSSRDLERFELEGGGWGIRLDGWADRSLGVELSANGEMRLRCTHDHQHADEEPGESPLK